MAGETGVLGAKRGSMFTVQGFCGLLMIIGLSALFNHFLHQLHDEYVMHPAAMMLLPPLAIAYFAAVIPLFVFIVHQDDYKNVNPLVASNYKFIIIKTYSTMKHHNLKVREKDL